MRQLQVGRAAARQVPVPVAVDAPQAYIAEDRRRALARGEALADRVRGSALFADVSGFTALTEALVAERGPQRGAEALTGTLSVVFDAVLAELHRYGGSVLYFSGDAVTCWLDGDDGLMATDCALAMQRALGAVNRVVLPSGRQVELSMKVAIAVGPARRFVVGDPRLQLIDVLAGRLMDWLAAAEQAASPGDVVLDESALDSLGDRVRVGASRTSAPSGRAVGVVRGLTVAPAVPGAHDGELPLSDDVVRPWLLPAVYERLRTGRGDFLAELRNAVPVFIRFEGIDYDDDADAEHRLNGFVTEAQHVVDRYGGNVLQLTVGDKGAYVYAVFGSPIAHEDDAARACSAALELLTLEAGGTVSGIRIGIASGRLRSGTYGHAARRTFCCLGDAVNVAARLMSAAPPGRVYVSGAVAAAAGDRYRWNGRRSLHLRGRLATVDAHELASVAARPARGQPLHALPIVGREPELALLDDLATRTLAGRGHVVGICAEAGLGKSRLLSEAALRLRGRGFGLHLGQAQPFGAHTAYAAWHAVWAGVLGVPPGAQAAELTARLTAELARVAPHLLGRLPLLGGVLGTPLPDNELTSGLSPKLRKESLEALLCQYLERRPATDPPLALVLEDCQWLDPLSRDLLTVLTRVVSSLPVQVVAAYRPPGDPDAPLLLDPAQAHVAEIRLSELEDAAAERLVVGRFAALTHRPDGPPPALTQLVLDRSQGNPFYLEELLTFVLQQGVDLEDEAALERLDLPDGLHNLVLSRIDTLTEAPRRTLKVASVVGQSLAVPLLRGAYPDLGSPVQVVDNLRALQSRDLVVAGDDETTYRFRHVVTREVAYASMPFAEREMVHEQVGLHLESTSAQLPLDLLAHHFWHSANLSKKRHYLRLAGEAAQAAYANSAAVDHYRRLLSLLDDSGRGPVLLLLGQVLQLTGGWADAEAAYLEALSLAEATADRLAGARARTALADVYRRQGRFPQAADALGLASSSFAALDDRAGVGAVLHLSGTIAAQRGRYDEARDRYRASLEIRRQLDDRPNMASLLSNLGVIAEYEADYAGARDLNEQALALRVATGDRWAIGVSQNNLGMICLLEADHEQARDRFAEAMRLNLEVGDLWMVAVAHNNLGNAHRGLGDLAQAGAHYAESLRAYRSYADRWALAILYEDVALLAVASGRPEAALLLAGAADAARQSLDAPRSPAQQDRLHAALAPARDAVGETSATTLREQGRALSEARAASLVEDLCSSAHTPQQQPPGRAS